MRSTLLVRLAALGTLCLVAGPAVAQESIPPELTLVRTAPPQARVRNSTAATANAACAGAACDTVWVGHKAGSYLGVGVGGVWDFDADAAGTDSTQGFRRWEFPFTSNPSAQPTDRPEWAYDYGNVINEGNTNLWAARDLAGRAYVKTGVAGAWHSDPMTNVRKNANPVTNGGEPSAIPIDGIRSAWCGLRASGDQTAKDALTGNYLNADLWAESAGSASVANGEWPGYPNLWDQSMYKDFPSSGTGTIAARVRTDLVSFVDNATAAGTGWFNPDPTSIANFVNNPSDSFMVYVGSPNESAFDTNRRWFSEVLDFSKPIEELFRYGNKMPVTGASDTSLSLSYSGIQPVGGNVRVVFRVKTNRARSDATTGTAAGPNTKDGAALVDDVQVDGGTVYGFETAASVTARSLIPDLALDGGAWATTGRPPATYFHIENVANLIYEDLCGAVGSPTRRCNLAGNVAVAGDFDHADKITIESNQYWATPTIDLAVRTSAPGTKNAQGIEQAVASRTNLVIDYDIYTGFMNLDQSIFWRFGGRYFAPLSVEPISTNVRTWSPWQLFAGLAFNPDPTCVEGISFNAPDNLSFVGIPAGQIDSLQAIVSVISQGFRFGGTDLGNTRGTYFDNLRVGLVRAPATAVLTQGLLDRFQDQFPVNESVPPGDNGAFDTTTAYVKTARNVGYPSNGAIAGDSLLATAAWTGNGVTTGTRLDLVFRIDPGPGNYTTKGLRSSALVEKDPAHPFWAAYMADNGAFGTGGNGATGPGHGASWNPNVWNSCRMDSAEMQLYPVNAGAPGLPIPNAWMGTIHEQDPKYATLGIARNVCFLVNPSGPIDNMTCSGTPPAAYATSNGGSPPPGTTIEGTKIIPDGYLSPGAHVEYFLRRSSLENPTAATLLYDTTKAYPQDAGPNTNYDPARWSSFDVLPDLWKSSRFGGSGLACMLMVDNAERRGSDPVYRGVADSLGFGNTSGAGQGWHVVDASPTDPTFVTGRGPNNPAGFVAANLGQYGESYDHFDVEGAEAEGAGHIGSRLTTLPAGLASHADKAGPSLAQLSTFYTSVVHLSGDLAFATLENAASNANDPSNDVLLYSNYLAGASSGNARGLWLSGDGIVHDAVHTVGGTFLTLVNGTFGADLVADNYSALAHSQASEVGLLPTAAWNHPGRIYGINTVCPSALDVLKLFPSTTGAAEAGEYQAGTGPGPWLASIYRPAAPGTREFRTLLDGFDLAHLRGNYATLGAVGTAPEGDTGRFGWFDDATINFLAVCMRNPISESIGDLPGFDGSRFANANLGAFPNPSLVARPVTLRFSLARAQEVTIRIYTVAGREVARFTRAAQAGANDTVWDGRASNGARVAPGVYFYRIGGANLPEGALQPARMVLLSAR